MNTKPDYFALDAAILAAITGGCDTFGAILDSRETRDEQGKIRDFRMLDRRLQALKRAGKIKFARPARGMKCQWMLV
jgi:hypothetical protein